MHMITTTNSLTIGQILGIAAGVLVFIGLIATCVIMCIFCLTPACLCYYRRCCYRKIEQLLHMATTTSTKNINYQPLPSFTGNFDAGYQQYIYSSPTYCYYCQILTLFTVTVSSDCCSILVD